MKKLKEDFVYKINMYMTFLGILLQIEYAFSLDYQKENDSNSDQINKIAAIIWVVSNIVRVIIFFLAFAYKPLYKLINPVSQIMTIAYILSEMKQISNVKLCAIVLSPVFYFSTLKFTSIVTILSNIGILVALTRAS